MKKYIVICMLAMPLAACSEPRHDDGMKIQLDSIRVMIKQSALMAVHAACSGAKERAMLVHAAAVMDRRAMGGPEMAKIHKMMNMQPDANGKMPMKQGGKMSAEMAQHVALHDAGEDVFDFLDDLSGGKFGCDQAAAVSMAANSAMLREAGGREPQEAARKLDARASALTKSTRLPDAVKALTLALQQI